MHTRNMERMTSIRERGKRGLEGEDEQQQPERKRPALASVIVEALKVDSLQKLTSSLEPILRRVVSEEVERALAKLGTAQLTNGRSSPKRIEGPDGRNLQLHFRSRMSLPLYTGGKVEGEHGAAIHVVLLDANTGRVVTSGPESSIKLDVVVLEGDFNNEDDEGWTQEDFESHVVKEREGKRPLLTGDVQVTLKEGVGTLGELTFTDNSSWIRSRKFRLGLKVASGFCEGVRVREAKTEAFAVRDHRGELYKKHYPPTLNDEVWRLEKIGKDGSFHKRLNKEGIFKVKDFLRLVVRDSQKLRNILGSGMSNKMWEALLEHAKTCVLSGKFYVYYPEDNKNVGVIFNNIYELSGLIAGDQYQPADSLSDAQKVYVDALVKKAYDNWNQVVEYDGKSLVSFKQPKRSGASRNDYSMGSIEYPRSSNNQQLPPRHPVVGPSDSLSVDSNLLLGGYNDNMDNVYQTAPQLVNTNTQYDINFATNGRHMVNSQQIQNNGYNDRSELALGRNFAKDLCWDLLSQQDKTVVWKKSSNKDCHASRNHDPSVCKVGHDVESPYYHPLEACIGGTHSRRWIPIDERPKWPSRATLSSKELAVHGVPFDDLIEDDLNWKPAVRNYWSLLSPLIFSDHPKRPGIEDPIPPYNMVRNVLDMNAHFGGFNSALLGAGKSVWVMNVVPTSGPNHLPLILDRGFVGVLHDWCEAFPTYPRTYDLVHAEGFLSLETSKRRRCSMLDVFFEMDRLLRPEGWVILRDTSSLIEAARTITTRLKWEARVVEIESNSDEKLLVCQKPLIRRRSNPS